MRTLSFGFGSLFLVGGVWALWLIPGVSKVSDAHGIRWGLAVLTPYWLVGGAVLNSMDAAISYVQGTPLRGEIEARDAGRLTEATAAAEEKVRARFGGGPIDAKIQAHVFTAVR